MSKLPRYFSRGYRKPADLLRRYRWGRQRVKHMVSDYDVWGLSTSLLEIFAYGAEKIANGHSYPIEYDDAESWELELLNQAKNARWVLADVNSEYLGDPNYPRYKFHTEPSKDYPKMYTVVYDNTPEEREIQQAFQDVYEHRANQARKDLYRFLRRDFDSLWD